MLLAVPFRSAAFGLRLRTHAAAFGLLLGMSAATSHAQTQHAPTNEALASLVEACMADSTRCTADAVPADSHTKLRNGVDALQSYEWLRSSLLSMRKAGTPERAKEGRLLMDRLGETKPDSSGIPVATARQQADRVLAAVEFAKAQPSWISRQWDRFTEWLSEQLRPPSGTERGWLRFLVEAVLLAVPLLFLVLWLLRQIREERLRPESIPLPSGERRGRGTPWLQLASEHRERGEWREAVHALYWHAIGTLEDRRLLDRTQTRTPREYLDLLEPGSTRRDRMRDLTRLLEVTWYGYRQPGEADVRHAEQLVREVAAA